MQLQKTSKKIFPSLNISRKGGTAIHDGLKSPSVCQDVPLAKFLAGHITNAGFVFTCFYLLRRRAVFS